MRLGSSTLKTALFFALALAFLYFTAEYNYNLFHGFTDGASIVIASCVFIVMWHSRHRVDNDYFLCIGIALLFFALVDSLHVLGNKDMGVFRDHGNLGPAFYIAGRYLLSASFLIAPLFVGRRLNTTVMFAAYSLISGLLALSILHWRVFPVCYIEGVGLTPFKTYSDYITCLMLAGGIALLVLKKSSFDPMVLRLIITSIALSIASGLTFTLYSAPFGITNMAGHVFQIASFYLMYRAVIETSLSKPQEILYRKLQESETKYRNLFTNMTEEVHFWNIVRDPRGGIKTWKLADANPPALQTWGKSLDDIRGKTTDEIFGPGATEHYLPLVSKVMSEGVPASYEDYFPHLEKYFWFTTIPCGGDSFITTGADITVRKRAQMKLEEQRAELEAAVRMRDEFLSIASHELKTPLTALNLQLQLLKRAGESDTNARIGSLSAGAFAASRRLEKLLDDLLDITRIRAGRLVLERKDMELRAAVSDGVAALSAQARQKGCDLTFKEGEPVIGNWDPDRMGQVIANLLSNAIKYGNGKPVDIEVRADHASQRAVLLVRDQGIGIPAEMHSKIFERFERAVSGSKITGLGLGLYIVRQIVDAHGGSIHVESQIGKGSLFTVELPL